MVFIYLEWLLDPAEHGVPLSAQLQLGLAVEHGELVAAARVAGLDLKAPI